MSKVFTAKEICERALRAVGAFPITDSAADGEQLREAMTWLDLLIGQIAGTGRLFNLIPATLSVAVTNGEASIDLEEALGADLPTDKIQFPVQAWLEDASGNRTPLDIVTRDRFDAVTNADVPGPPCMIHIDRLPAPTLRMYPVPSAEDTTVYTIKLDVQTYAPNVAPGGVTGTTPSGSILHRFRQAWQRWLVLQLSIDLGGGPIIKLPQASLNNWIAQARDAKSALEAFENREHETQEPITEAWV